MIKVGSCQSKLGKCNICNKKVLSRACYINCDVCCTNVHIKCLNQVTKKNELYTKKDDNNWICTCCSSRIFPFNHYDDDLDFLMAVSGSSEKYMHLPFNLLKNQNIIFQPLDLNEDDGISPLDNIDPDLQYYINQIKNKTKNCDYHFETSFNKLFKKAKIDNEPFSIIHENIRSIPKNLDKFINYLMNIELQFSIIGLTETWLKDHSRDLYNIDGYSPVHNIRKSRTGGGVSLYIKDNIDFKIREDLTMSNDLMETLFIEIDKNTFGKNKNTIVGVVYRPPDTDIDSFNKSMGELLSKTHTKNNLLYIMGDFNINLINVDKHIGTHDFLDIIYENTLFPAITKPTRVTFNSATLIDNIFIPIENDETIQGILYTDISDHFPVFVIDHSNKCSSEPPVQYKRMFNDKNKSKFISQISSTNWAPVHQSNDAQEAYTIFHNTFTHIFNDCFPSKPFKLGYKNRKPWIPESIKKCIKKKNKMYWISINKRAQDPEYQHKYRQYKNELSNILSRLEKEHYNKILSQNKADIKKTWSILKSIINKHRANRISSKFKVNGKLTTDKVNIANAFNDFYINVGPNLARKISSNGSPIDFLNEPLPDDISLERVEQDEVKQIVSKLKSSSSGWDEIPSLVVKQTIDSTSEPLTHIFNLSLSTGVFPIEMKIAKVIPLFKSGDTTSFSNYRPVSVLSVFSKILERLMYKRLLDFINHHNLLYDYQFGFRNKRSPNLALILLVDKISNALENGEYVLGLFLDFSKAFDTVNHEILFIKLEHYGIRGTALNLFKHYLKDRTQYVVYNGLKSEKQHITCGVPQGSILGPLLFLIYINDLGTVSNKIFTLLFADDSNLFLSGKNPDQLIQEMNLELIKVIKWLEVNKLSLNIGKTHFIIFRKGNTKLTINEDLIIKSEKIKQEHHTKFLGVVLDQRLTFLNHILLVKGKMARAMGILYKCKKSLNQNTLLTLYNAFIYPYLNYCICVWGNTYQAYLKPLITLQNRAIRTVTNSNWDDSAEPLYKRVKALSLNKLHTYSVQLFVYKLQKGDVPPMFENFFVPNSSIHTHLTRQAINFRTPIHKTFQFYRSVKCVGVKTFNYFHNKVDMDCSYITYKWNLKNFILNNNVKLEQYIS